MKYNEVKKNHLPVNKKRELLSKYNLPPVNLLGIYQVSEAPSKILKLVKELGENGREGVVIKDPQMMLPPLKYTSSQAHDDELEYAFKFPFDLGKAFMFSRVIREGFQSVEMQDSEEELEKRAHRIGESILYPLLLKRPETRLNTPEWFSTKTESTYLFILFHVGHEHDDQSIKYCIRNPSITFINCLSSQFDVIVKMFYSLIRPFLCFSYSKQCRFSYL